MNKLLVLGDIHGRTVWKDIIDKENPDKTIFLGDYCTSHEDILSEIQIENLENILEYKEANPDSTFLLRGNHDIQMLGYEWAECYPKEPKVQEYLSRIDNKVRFLKLTQWIVISEELNIIFSHAGISKVWMENNDIKSIYDINKENPSEIFSFCPNTFYDNHGNSTSQPPTWIRPQALLKCYVDGWDQIVGHTPVTQDIINLKDYSDCSQNIWLCDALENYEYIVIENKQVNIKSL